MMPQVDGLEVARRLRADVILSKTPILMLTALASIDNKVEGLEAGADDYLGKPFDLRELAARVKALIRASKRERDRNPTTSLPGSSAVETHLAKLLQGAGDDVVVHVDVSGFDVWADHVGFSIAEKAVAELGRTILDRVKAHTAGDAFLGHLGGVDFVAACATAEGEALATEIIDAFDGLRGAWTSGEGEAKDDAVAAAAKLCCAIAIAPIDGLSADDSKQLADRMAAAMRAAKARGSSAYVVWQRQVS
jgi:GGDEF domain-containing protein